MLIAYTGYKEFKTGRKYMALMGDWRENKDEELELDGVGGVSIVVKADVHRSGKVTRGASRSRDEKRVLTSMSRYQLPLLCL